MSSRHSFAAAVALLLVPLLAAPARAQEQRVIPVPLADVSAGYTFMRDFENVADRDGTNFPGGWFTSGSFNVTKWFGVVGEATGSYKNHFLDGSDGTTQFGTDARVYTAMGGPRFFYKHGRFAPYGQLLAGVGHMRVTAKATAGGLSASDTEGSTNFSVQPGGGLTVYLTETVGVRVAADYRSIIDFEGANSYQHQLRLASGLAFNWGRR